MDPIIVTLITGGVSLLAALTALVKQKTDNLKIRAAREDTKVQRDAEFKEIRDKVLEHGFKITTLEGTQVHHLQLFEDLRTQVSTLTVTVAELNATMRNFLEKMAHGGANER